LCFPYSRFVLYNDCMTNLSELWNQPAHPTRVPLPFYLNPVQAGFPSPAEDYVDATLDLNEFMIDRPSATYFVRVSGDSMINAGINSGDILIVDRSKTAHHGAIVVAQVDNDFTVKRLQYDNGKVNLCPENDAFKTITIADDQLVTMGVVTGVVRRL
jgi:DNA polymerase V